MKMNETNKSAADIYVFDVDPNSDTAAANVLRLAGKDKDVLEIGAGPGSIARPLVEKNGCRVTALEADPKCLPILRKFCVDVIHGDLNQPDWDKAFSGRSFDVIVIADVLEHLIDPWQTLRIARKLLRPNGTVVSSIPNASHAAMIASILNNDVDYRDWGLLDRTHVRFFGAKNIQNLFRQADLKIVDARYVVRTPEMTEFVDTWRLTSAQLRGALELPAFSQVYQTVVLAVDANSTRPEFELVHNPPSKIDASLTVKLIGNIPQGTMVRSLIGRFLGKHGRKLIKNALGIR
ncbi:class I SAM-dependent methyltransferase [Mesorhizobium sp. ES1-4]|uniref:class I SAM-dependent methyltransferase n=1 Tax=Mesorhizobium sp. ES1-4 TaxID=2876627 RepID=UPI001CCF9C9F|nr:class I SAM-dependent methyltransferase [Mesorhizobium sp. ES1-4]MBZ9795688.1 class I SAM-dependent methyltransferase [Mesorhizobium sp. ES1-4]